MRLRQDLELRYRWISNSFVVLFSTALALGLMLSVVDPTGQAASAVVHAGLLLLIASPAARMAVATAERVRQRDWVFLGMILVIVLELVIVLWRAFAE